MSLEAAGIHKEALDKVIDDLADRAQGDQYTITNPKCPLVTELVDVYRRALKG